MKTAAHSSLRTVAQLKIDCSVISLAVRALGLHVNNCLIPSHCFRIKHRFILCNWNIAQFSCPRVFPGEYCEF